MAAAIVVPDDLNVGDALEITGTGFALTHAYTITVVYPDREAVILSGTTSGAGAVDSTDEATLVMNKEGNVEVTVDDGTTAVSATARVWRT